MGRLLRALRLIRPVLPQTDACREWYGDLEVDEDRFSAMLAELEPLAAFCRFGAGEPVGQGPQRTRTTGDPDLDDTGRIVACLHPATGRVNAVRGALYVTESPGLAALYRALRSTGFDKD